MVAPVGLEPTRVAPMDFESIVSTIPPSRLNIGRTVGYEKIIILQKRLTKKTLPISGESKNPTFSIL